MDPIWIAVAFILGFLVKQIGLPPLVGFLLAGFVLNAFGVESNEALEEIADLGVYLLLFSIGLKLRIRNLLRPQIWATTTVHMLVTVVLFGALFFAVASAGLSIFAGLDLTACLVIAFAASFSSTVFAVKMLDEKGDGESRHGRLAIGILIMQDLFAVLFITASGGKAPSVWALALLGFLVIRSLIFIVLDRSGHGELLVLLGLLLPTVAVALFAHVGLKPDLGALLLGVLLSTHPKADELSKTLLSFKDLFLVGFFLTIGLSGLPSLAGFAIAAFFIVLLPIKVALFFLLLTRFRLRARTATVTSLTLANYSEFGLIVGAVGVNEGWISGDWLVILAIALSLSFVLASPLNLHAQSLFERMRSRLALFETETRLTEDQKVSVGDAEFVIVGMGRVGTAAFEELSRRSGGEVIGLDYDLEVVRQHREVGRNAVFADGTDLEFWVEQLERKERIKVLILATGSHVTNINVVVLAQAWHYNGVIAATARHVDEVEELRKAGANCALDFMAEAGTGLAEHAYETYKSASV